MVTEPAEAEFANPPIFTDREERQHFNQDIESSSPVSSSPTPTLHNQAPARVTGDIEKGRGDKIIVNFDEGENPRQWGKAKKWYVLAHSWWMS